MKFRDPSSRRRGFTDVKRGHLFCGMSLIDGYGYEGDEGEILADWERYGAELLAEWLAACEKPVLEREHGFGHPNPDSMRPWGWWEFESPGPRPEKTAEAEFQFLAQRGLLLDGDEARCDLLAREQEFKREQTRRYERQQALGPYGRG